MAPFFAVIKRLLSILLILLLSITVVAQLPKKRTVDSLTKLISATRADTERINLLCKLSNTYYAIDYKKGIETGNEALTLSKHINWRRGVAYAYNALGSNYWAQYDFIRAQDNYGASLSIAEEIGDNTQVAIATHNIGVCYESQNKLAKAIAYYEKAAYLYGKLNNKLHQMGCYSNIADIYIKLNKYNNALKFYRHALIVAQLNSNERDMGFYQMRIGVCYYSLHQLNNALTYELNALRKFASLRDYEDMATNLLNLSDIYVKKNAYQEAVQQNEQALTALTLINDINTQKIEADSYRVLGEIYLKWAESTAANPADKSGLRAARMLAARKNFEKSMRISTAADYKESVIDVLKDFSNLEEREGNFDQALAWYKKYVRYRDNLSRLENEKQYTSHELEFEYSKRRDSLNYAEKLQKKELEQIKLEASDRLKQRSLFGLVVIVLLLLVASYFVFRNRVQNERFKSKFAKEKSEAELLQMSFENRLNDLTLASLKSQMNPHFIFNCLNSIKFYVEKNDTEAASLYITKFSRLIRNILDSARSEKITLSTEIDLIRLYLEMEAMRLKDKFNYEFDIDDKIDMDFIEIPPLLIQPYLENAIWHGLMPKESPGLIRIFLALSPDKRYLIINITDDGIGRTRAAALKAKSLYRHTSYGSALNAERLEMFNAKYNAATEVIITDLQDANEGHSGTKVTIKHLIQ